MARVENIVVVGAQLGDEGKGRIIDLISEKFDIITRFQGGSNAGHTIIIKDKKRPIKPIYEVSSFTLASGNT